MLLDVVRRSPVRLAEVAASEGINPTMLSRVISDLVEAGLLQRLSDQHDRRAAWIRATPAGRRLAERMRRERTEAVNAALTQLSTDQQRSIQAALPALEALADQLAEERP